MRALLIRHPHIDKILAGRKKWEIRGSRTTVRETIALVASGSGTVIGVCNLVDCRGPLTAVEYRKNARKAGNRPGEVTKRPYKRTYAWVVDTPKTLNKPVPYTHPSGAIIWVKLDTKVERQILKQTAG
jgi:hypothetical protein